MQAKDPARGRADHRARRHQLKREFGISVILVTHEVGVAVEICDRVAVMYAGQIVEQGKPCDVVRTPAHPYARGLLASTAYGAKR